MGKNSLCIKDYALECEILANKRIDPMNPMKIKPPALPAGIREKLIKV
jgi:hypothetical protein